MQARSDKGTMIKYELLKDSKLWEVNTDEDYISQLKKGDRELVLLRRNEKRPFFASGLVNSVGKVTAAIASTIISCLTTGGRS